MNLKSQVTDVYVVQRAWRVEGRPDQWIDYRSTSDDIEAAREMLKFASMMSGFKGPFRIVHRATAVYERLVDP